MTSGLWVGFAVQGTRGPAGLGKSATRDQTAIGIRVRRFADLTGIVPACTARPWTGRKSRVPRSCRPSNRYPNPKPSPPTDAEAEAEPGTEPEIEGPEGQEDADEAPSADRPWRRAFAAGLSTWAAASISYFLINSMVWLMRSESGPRFNQMLEVWNRWDTGHYLSIALKGYNPDNESAAFFPLYPLLIRYLEPLLPGGGLSAALIISHAACLAALTVLFRLVEDVLGEANARRTVTYLMAYPFAFFLVTAYNESVFLLFCVAGFYCMRQGTGSAPACGAAWPARPGRPASCSPSPSRSSTCASAGGATRLGHLHHVERGPLAQVVAADEEVERVREVRAPGAAGRRSAGRSRRRRDGVGNSRLSGSSSTTTAGASTRACRASATSIRRANVACTATECVVHDGHPHAGRRDAQVGQAEHLAGLVADLELLGRPAVPDG